MGAPSAIAFLLRPERDIERGNAGSVSVQSKVLYVIGSAAAGWLKACFKAFPL